MFKKIKIKLTTLYLSIIMFVTLSFSGFVYLSVVRITQTALEAQRARVERRIVEFGMYPKQQFRQQPLFDEDAFYEIRRKTLSVLILINLGVLVTSAILGYVLSGKTLAPIEVMVNKQKRFISDAAHELKTPLTAMKTDFEVTLRDKNFDKDTARNVIKSSISEIDTLSRFISALLTKSRYQNAVVKRQPVNVSDVVQKVVNKLSVVAEEKEQRIKTDLVDAWIFGDPNGIEDLFRNLIDNAVKYNKPGETVIVKVEIFDDRVVAVVSDKGIGISQEELANIFEPFYRAETSRGKNTYDGYGLGLSIVKDIVDSHEGRINVESEKDKGTTFTVSFKKVPKT